MGDFWPAAEKMERPANTVKIKAFIERGLGRVKVKKIQPIILKTLPFV
jgi:hypothetical protein